MLYYNLQWNRLLLRWSTRNIHRYHLLRQMMPGDRWNLQFQLILSFQVWMSPVRGVCGGVVTSNSISHRLDSFLSVNCHKNQKTTFYHWKFLMNKLQSHYESTGGIIVPDCTVKMADEMFNIAKECMAPFVTKTAKKRKREREAQTKVTTIATVM